jgi:hypothetical protein
MIISSAGARAQIAAALKTFLTAPATV